MSKKNNNQKYNNKKQKNKKNEHKKNNNYKKINQKSKIKEKKQQEKNRVKQNRVKEQPVKEEIIQKEEYVVKAKINIISILLFFIFVVLLTGTIQVIYKGIYIEQERKLELIEVKEDIIIENELSLIMVGDCLIHGAIYDDAKENGGYNFYKMIENVKPIIEKYDLAFYNQESILGGTSLGLSSYPRFNSPQEVGDTFIDMGFNLVGLANNHTLDMGKRGIRASLEYWKKKENIMTAGSYSSEEERITPNIMEKNGITYALLSYTTTTNGLTVPSDEPYLVSTYEEAKVKEDIERLRDKVDVLMVSMHWGEEYTHNPTESQRNIANYLASLNVDIVIGHHPHVIQPIDFIGNTMVIYSLGNFIASQYGVEKLTGLMASVTIKKTTINGESTITLENPTAELVYTYSVIDRYRHSYKLYPYTMLNDNLLSNYEKHYEKYMNIVTSMNERIQRVSIK